MVPPRWIWAIFLPLVAGLRPVAAAMDVVANTNDAAVAISNVTRFSFMHPSLRISHHHETP
jgi:hypothetical protein